MLAGPGQGNQRRYEALRAYIVDDVPAAEVADQFFEKCWIDASVREGKQPGAFSHPTVPSAHPYVLLNYMGKPRDVMTLAHELGKHLHTSRDARVVVRIGNEHEARKRSNRLRRCAIK